MLTLTHKVNPDVLAKTEDNLDTNYPHAIYEGGGFAACASLDGDEWRIDLSIPDLDILSVYYRKRRPKPSDVRRIAQSWATAHGYRIGKKK